MTGTYPAYDMPRYEGGCAAIKLADEIMAVDPGSTDLISKLRKWGESEKDAAHFKTLEEAKAHFGGAP